MTPRPPTAEERATPEGMASYNQMVQNLNSRYQGGMPGPFGNQGLGVQGQVATPNRSPLGLQQMTVGLPGPTPTATSTASLADKPNIYGLNDFTGNLADPSTLRFTPQDRTQTQQVTQPAQNVQPYQILRQQPSAPMQTMNDMFNTGSTLSTGNGLNNRGTGMIEPAVMGPMLDQYRQNRGLGGANPGLGGPPPGQNIGGGFGGGFGGNFGGNFNSMQNRPIPDIAAQTVGETVSQAIQSRIPQMSQGIGSLIGQSLLSHGGGRNPMQAIQSLF